MRISILQDERGLKKRKETRRLPFFFSPELFPPKLSKLTKTFFLFSERE
jgi:hypothetical protein